jgi:hypothetical protein
MMKHCLVLSVALVCMPALAAAQQAAEGPPVAPATKPAVAEVPEQATKKALERILPEVNLSAVPLIEAIDYFRDATGQNFYVEWNALRAVTISQNARVTYKAEKVKAADALTEALKPIDDGAHKITFGILGRTVVVSTPESLRDVLGTARGDQYKANDPEARKILLRELPSVNFKRTSFREAIDVLRDISGATIEVKWDTIVAAGISRDTPVTLKLNAIPFKEALRLLLLDAGGTVPIDFTIENNVVSVFVPNPL